MSSPSHPRRAISPNVVVAGRYDAAGAQTAFLRRYDGSGDLDTSWGAGGEITWDAAGDDAATALNYERATGELLGRARRADAGLTRMYDYAGDLESSVTPGRTRVLMHGDINSSSKLTIDKDLQIGNAADAGSVLVDLDSYDLGVEVRGTLNVDGARGQLRASSGAPLTVLGNLSILGTFWPNTGTVQVISRALRPIIAVGASTVFHNLSISAADKGVAISPANTVTVKNAFTARGAGCTQRLSLVSTTPGTPWKLNLTGGAMATVDAANLNDSTALVNGLPPGSALATTNTTNGGGFVPAPPMLPTQQVAPPQQLAAPEDLLGKITGVQEPPPIVQQRIPPVTPNRIRGVVQEEQLASRSDAGVAGELPPDYQEVLFVFRVVKKDAAGNVGQVESDSTNGPKPAKQ